MNFISSLLNIFLIDLLDVIYFDNSIYKILSTPKWFNLNITYNNTPLTCGILIF
jgi:hypothetical protein